MSAAYRDEHGKDGDHELPGRPLMSKRLEDIEDNDPEADALNEIASKAEGEDDMLLAETDIAVALRAATRKTKTVPAPANSEQLRRRYKIEDNSFIYAKYKHGSKTWLHDFTKGTFGSLADYILGDKVLAWKQLHIQTQACHGVLS